MNREVIHENAPLLHHLLDVAQAQRISRIPTHAGEHHLKLIVQPFEDLAQGAVDQTLAEIKHGPDCRLWLSQQNRLEYALIARRTWKTKTQARLSVFTWFESGYNPHRRNSGLNYKSPNSFERKHPEDVKKTETQITPELQ
jgi:transposase InsO family protein